MAPGQRWSASRTLRDVRSAQLDLLVGESARRDGTDRSVPRSG